MRLARPIIPLLLLLLIFIGGGVFIASQWTSATRNRDLIDRSHRVIETSLTMVKEMVDAETAQRGYVITGDDAFLTPFKAAEISVPERFQQLRALGGRDNLHRESIDAIEQLWAQRLARIRTTIDEVGKGDMKAARDVIAEGSGRELMDRIRTESDRLQSQEYSLLTERLAASDRTRDNLGVTISAALLVAGIGMALSVITLTRRAATLVRDVQSQRQIARTLEEATFELAGEVSSVRAELGHTALRFNAALRSAPIAISSQDQDLRYLWMRNSLLDRPADWFIGRTDLDVMPEPACSRLVEMKRDAMRSGEPRDFEVHLATEEDPEGRWYDMHVEPTRDEKGAVDGVTTVAIEVSERKRRERHVRLLMRELAHRSKNTLAVTQAMARQTAANSTSIDEFLDRFADRLEALGRAHSLLVNEGWTGASIEDLARAQLGHYSDLVGRQVFLAGPPLTLPTDAIQNIGLALHELATNAAKYGALSTPQGRVDLTWVVVPNGEGGQAVTMRWIESGGPKVEPPTRRGFGSVVVERTVARAVGGEVELTHHPDGVRWELRFLARPSEPEAPPHSAASA